MTNTVAGNKIINWYAMLDEDIKKTITSKDYCAEFLEALAGMFVYQVEGSDADKDLKTLEDNLNHFLEVWLRSRGMVAFTKDGDKIYFGCASFSGGTLDKYGFTDKVIITTYNGESKEYLTSDVVLIFNNALGCSEQTVYRYADKLTEIDISMDCAILGSRFNELLLVKNEKVLNQINKAVEDIKDGKPIVIDGQDLLGSELMNSQREYKGVEVLNITDVANSDKLQYLTHFHDDLMRTFYQKYGIDTNATGKMAQQSTEEIEGNVGRSFIVPNQNYNWRVKGLEAIKEKFGISINISWGESWGIELSKYKADIDNEGEYSEDPIEENDQENDQKNDQENENKNGEVE